MSLVLVLNCGSSSIKFAVIDPVSTHTLVSGLVQCIGGEDADLQIKFAADTDKLKRPLPNVNYSGALQAIIDELQRKRSDGDLLQKIIAVGHRVVHGAEEFIASTLVNAAVLGTIKKCVRLAPLHNPANITGIEEAQRVFPHLPHIAVFDTAFHQTMPQHAFIYPIPYAYYTDHRVRRYGFHGTSHRFVSREAALRLNVDLTKSAFITAHLGNGCSAAAVLNGESVDTTMGLTPLEGLMMGTRSGDIDPSLHSYLVDNLGLDVHKVTEIFNKKSGLLGISNKSSDMRAIEAAVEEGDAQSILALEIFCYRLAKHIAALAVPLGRVDALVFTGGIGENSPCVRAKTLNWLRVFACKPDLECNAINGKESNGVITTPDSKMTAIVIPTNEELLIAQDAMEIASCGKL